MKNIKNYSEVKVGDIAYETPDGNGNRNGLLGKITWKGTAKELVDKKKDDMFIDWGQTAEEIDESFDLVIVELYIYGETLYNYNNDPCGCVVYEEKINITPVNPNQFTIDVLETEIDSLLTQYQNLDDIRRSKHNAGLQSSEYRLSGKMEGINLAIENLRQTIFNLKNI